MVGLTDACSVALLCCLLACNCSSLASRLASQRGSDGSRAEPVGRCAGAGGRRLAEEGATPPLSVERRGRGHEGQNSDGTTAGDGTARLRRRGAAWGDGGGRDSRLETRHASGVCCPIPCLDCLCWAA
jgi:hypothetical protein